MTEPKDPEEVDAFNEGVSAATDAAAASALPDSTPPGTFDPADTAEPPPLEDLPDDVPDGDVGETEPEDEE